MSSRRPRRNTRQRELILDELRKLDSHPTAVGLHEIVRRRLPSISLGTVYRNLELLAAAGTIQKLDLGRSRARFDANTDQHHHVRCTACGRVDDLPAAALDLTNLNLDDCNGYVIRGYRLEFLGICPRCREQSPTSRDSQQENQSC